jgi:hypothetical protein
MFGRYKVQALVIEDATGIVVNTIVIDHLTDVAIDGHTLIEHPYVSSKDGTFKRYHPITLGEHHLVAGRIVDANFQELAAEPNVLRIINHLDSGKTLDSFRIETPPINKRGISK